MLQARSQLELESDAIHIALFSTPCPEEIKNHYCHANRILFSGWNFSQDDVEKASERIISTPFLSEINWLSKNHRTNSVIQVVDIKMQIILHLSETSGPSNWTLRDKGIGQKLYSLARELAWKPLRLAVALIERRRHV